MAQKIFTYDLHPRLSLCHFVFICCLFSPLSMQKRTACAVLFQSYSLKQIRNIRAMIQSYTRLIHRIAQNNTIANANTNIPNKLIHVWPLSAGMNFPIKRYSHGAAKVEPAYTMIALVPTCENHRFLELITLISATIIKIATA